MRPRATILVKLLVALVIPTVALFTLFATVAYEMNKRDLDEELGARLEAIAASAAIPIKGRYLVDLDRDQTEFWAYQRANRDLEIYANATGVELSLFDRNFESLGDSEDVPLRTHLFRAELDRQEIAHVFDHGATVSSVTFTGEDGKLYKAGYAPVRGGDGDMSVVLALRAQAPASYFDRLEDLRDRLFLWGAGLVIVSVFAAVLTTLFITRNVRRLAAAAAKIGSGELREKIEIRSADELGQLGQAMDRMRLQLAERDARTQQMLAGIAHEVRNPLAGMTLFAGILRDELPDGDERRGHVDKIQRELGYLERVVNDFLEYARRPKPELAPVEVSELLAEVAQLASTDDVPIVVQPSQGSASPDRAATRGVAESRSTLEVRADRGQIRRALLNLAKNAVQAATAAGHRGSGAVKLAARSGGGEVHFEVWNRGKEISPETSGKLFEPFYTTREKGTGLGLAFVREIAVDHGGRVEIASADGETTFSLIIPS